MEEQKKNGRPSLYSEELVDRICEKISTSSKGLHSIISENEGFPSFGTVFKWLSEPDKKYFVDKYAHARELQAEFMADEMIRIADDSSNDTEETEFGVRENKEWTNRSKLRVETRKWIASKLKPKVYGDKLDITTKDQPINNLPDLSKLSYEQLLELAKANPNGSEEGNSKA